MTISTWNGIFLEILDENESESVLFVHGLGGSTNSFQPILAAFAGKQKILVDLPGSALSPLPDGDLTIPGLSRTLIDMLDHLKIDSVHLVGHSMGTVICQHMAQDNPGRVASMVLLGALDEPPAPARDGLKARADAARTNGMTAIAETIQGVSVAQIDTDASLTARAFVRESLSRQSPEGYARTCEALSDAEKADISKFEAPALLVTGDKDPVGPPEVGQRIADSVRKGTLKILPDCGHWPTVEQPLALIGHIEDFYRDF